MTAVLTKHQHRKHETIAKLHFGGIFKAKSSKFSLPQSPSRIHPFSGHLVAESFSGPPSPQNFPGSATGDLVLMIKVSSSKSSFEECSRNDHRVSFWD